MPSRPSRSERALVFAANLTLIAVSERWSVKILCWTWDYQSCAVIRVHNKWIGAIFKI
jgi:hypothetical protein